MEVERKSTQYFFHIFVPIITSSLLFHRSRHVEITYRHLARTKGGVEIHSKKIQIIKYGIIACKLDLYCFFLSYRRFSYNSYTIYCKQPGVDQWFGSMTPLSPKFGKSDTNWRVNKWHDVILYPFVLYRGLKSISRMKHTGPTFNGSIVRGWPNLHEKKNRTHNFI